MTADGELHAGIGPERQDRLVHLASLGQPTGALIEDAEAEKGVDVLCVALQGAIEITFSGTEIAFHDFGEAALGFIVFSKGNALPERWIEHSTIHAASAQHA